MFFTESKEPEQIISFFNIISGKRGSYIASNSRLNKSSDCSQAMLCPDHTTQNIYHPLHKADVLKEGNTEIEEFDMDPEETTSDKAPMIRMGVEALCQK